MFFKKRVKFPQYVANMIFWQYELLDKRGNELAEMSDEGKVLNSTQKDKLLEMAQALVVADIYLGIQRIFSIQVTVKDTKEVVMGINRKYLTDIKSMNDLAIKAKESQIDKLMKEYERVVAEEAKNNTKNVSKEDSQTSLCQAFVNLFAGKPQNNDEWLSTSFAALKLAKGLVKSDMVLTASKDVRVIFK